jgi:hypothetical protein
MFRKFLALPEAENDSLDLIILKNRAAQDAIGRRFSF